MHMPNEGTHIYFASDFHLGVPDYTSSLIRERKIVRWLESIRYRAAEIFLMGDLFDFWFEYKTVVPKGYVRLLGKLAEITDSGVPVHIFKGNHDIWAFEYLHREVGVHLHRKPQIRQFSGKSFYLAHGDGLGPGDHGYKFLKTVFENRFNQWIFRWLHPDIGTRIGLYFSLKSRIANVAREEKNNFEVVPEKERLFAYCNSLIRAGKQYDFYIFGHRHTPIDFQLSKQSRMIILGDWVTNFTYSVFDGEKLEMKQFND